MLLQYPLFVFTRMYYDNIISVPGDNDRRVIYHSPAVVLKAMDLEYRPLWMNLNRLTDNGILKHWHKGAYEFNDATVYKDISFEQLYVHIDKALRLNAIPNWQPIIVVDNKLVDGAHRLLATKISGRSTILALSLRDDEFFYILSQLNPLSIQKINMTHLSHDTVVAIDTVTKMIREFASGTVPENWTTDIPHTSLLPFVEYHDGRWVPDRSILLPALHDFLRMQCRVAAKHPIEYAGTVFYFGKYELSTMLSLLAVAGSDDETVCVPNIDGELVQLTVGNLKNLLQLHNTLCLDASKRQDERLKRAKELNDDELLAYSVELFNKPIKETCDYE